MPGKFGDCTSRLKPEWKRHKGIMPWTNQTKVYMLAIMVLHYSTYMNRYKANPSSSFPCRLTEKLQYYDTLGWCVSTKYIKVKVQGENDYQQYRWRKQAPNTPALYKGWFSAKVDKTLYMKHKKFNYQLETLQNNVQSSTITQQFQTGGAFSHYVHQLQIFSFLWTPFKVF